MKITFEVKMRRETKDRNPSECSRRISDRNKWRIDLWCRKGRDCRQYLSYANGQGLFWGIVKQSDGNLQRLDVRGSTNELTIFELMARRFRYELIKL